MNEQTFHHPTHAPHKEGPFLPGMNARGILGRFGEKKFGQQDVILPRCINAFLPAFFGFTSA